MSVTSRSSVTRTSGDVFKYGDVEKEKEIEKRLKELGLWSSKVYQEKEVEKKLEERIDKSDRLSHVIRKTRRRRERSDCEGGEQERREKEAKSEGMRTMNEIRDIVKPTVVRDRSGIPLAYHIDVTMGCFTYDVTHHVTPDGHVVVLFGATSPSNPLVSMSFLSSKSLPSLFSPAISPRSTSPTNWSTADQGRSTVISESGAGFGSTLRYGREADGGEGSRAGGGGGQEVVTTDTRRLTKEISVELPRTVDVSQLIVEFRKGVFKIRVPFFLDAADQFRQNNNNNLPSERLRLKESLDKFPSSRLFAPLGCQTSLAPISSSSPSSPSMLTKPRSVRVVASPGSLSPSPHSPAASHSTGRAFHCTLLPQNRPPTNSHVQTSSHQHSLQPAQVLSVNLETNNQTRGRPPAPGGTLLMVAAADPSSSNPAEIPHMTQPPLSTFKTNAGSSHHDPWVTSGGRAGGPVPTENPSTSLHPAQTTLDQRGTTNPKVGSSHPNQRGAHPSEDETEDFSRGDSRDSRESREVNSPEDGRRFTKLKDFFERRGSDDSGSEIQDVEMERRRWEEAAEHDGASHLQARYNEGRTRRQRRDFSPDKISVEPGRVPADPPVTGASLPSQPHFSIDRHTNSRKLINEDTTKQLLPGKCAGELISSGDRCTLDCTTHEVQRSHDRSAGESTSGEKLNHSEVFSLDDLVRINSAWSNSEDIDALVERSSQSAKRKTRSLTVNVAYLEQNGKRGARSNNSKKKKPRSKSLPLLKGKFLRANPSNDPQPDERIAGDGSAGNEVGEQTIASECISNDDTKEADVAGDSNSQHPSNLLKTLNFDSMLDSLEETNV